MITPKQHEHILTLVMAYGAARADAVASAPEISIADIRAANRAADDAFQAVLDAVGAVTDWSPADVR